MSFDAYSEALQELQRIPGARYSCVAEATSSVVLAERGAIAVETRTVLTWGAVVTGGLAAGDELDDLIVTGFRYYHLLRRASGSSDPPVVVYLCLDRARANLAVARRALGGVRFGARPAPALPPGAPAPLSPPPVLPRQRTPDPDYPLRAASTWSPTVPPRPSAEPGNGLGAPHRVPSPGPEPGQRVAAPAPRPPSAVPLPRRRPAPVPAGVAPTPPPRPPGVSRWAHDVSTMRRLLAGLRNLQ